MDSRREGAVMTLEKESPQEVRYGGLSRVLGALPGSLSPSLPGV